MPNAENNLLKRSPRSRKSLAVGKSTKDVSPKRKRAHSIVPGEKIKLNAPRRSILRPPRGILKPSNQIDPSQDTLQNTAQFLPPSSNPNAQDSIDASSSFSVGDFHTAVHDNNTIRKSLGGRRVSFAAHAHVRVFETNDQQANEKSPSNSPTSSGANNIQNFPEVAPTNSPQTHRAGVQSQPYVNNEYDDDDDDGEESMELSDDNIIIPPVSAVDMSFSESMSLANDSFTDDGNMSMTGDFGDGIFSQRQQAPIGIAEPRRRSRMRSSITVPVSSNGATSTEFTVSLDRPPPPESDAFKALKAMANANRQNPDEENSGELEETDMDVTTAVSRLIAARNSVGGLQPDDSFSSEDSMDAEDDRTMNMTSVLGNLKNSETSAAAVQEDDDSDESMSVASVIEEPILKPRPSQSSRPQLPRSPSKESVSQSRIPVPLPVPKFVKAVEPGSRLPITGEKTRNTRRESSVGKEIPPLFKPLANPVNRPVSPKKPRPSDKAPLPGTSNQEANQAKLPPGPPEPSGSQIRPTREEIAKSTRRPSGYYRKSLGPTSNSESNDLGLAPYKDTRGNYAIEDTPSNLGRQTLPEKSPVRQKQFQQPPVNDSLDSLDMEQASPREESPILLSPSQRKLQSMHSVSVDSVNEDDMEPISIEQFLTMSNIRFMDDLTCPRRSTIHPSQMKRRVSHEDPTDSPPLSSYVIAMAIHVAQLETMIWISNDIKTAIDKYKIQYQQTEDDVAKDIPLLFREYFAASDEDREPIMYVLKLIKTNTISSARANWYEWKRGWIQGLQVNALRTLENLYTDENQLLDFTARAGETVPLLRAEYESILQELESERAEIAEIEQCDQQFLSELKATIAEQSHELDLLKAELEDGENKLKRLQETAEELAEQSEQAAKVIRVTQRQLELQKTSTRAEVFRLRGELQYLQSVHLWEIVNMNPSSIELLYDSRFRVIIPCRRFTPVPEALRISPTGDTKQDDFPLLSQLMMVLASRYAVQGETKATLRSIIQRLSDFWASYFQLRWQLNFIIIKYPISCQLFPSDSTITEAKGFQVTTTLLLLNKTAKVLINFIFDEDLVCQWPNTLQMLQYTVQVVYGQLNGDNIQEALRSRLSEAKPEENHACLVDACMEVISRFG